MQALEGLDGVGMPDATQKRELGRLRDRSRTKRGGRSRAASAAASA